MMSAVFMALNLTAAEPPFVDLPLAMQGIWVADDRQCRRHRAALAAGDQGQIIGTLVGALVIEGDLIHDVAEYGEGNFYRAITVIPAGSGRWTIEAPVGIDTIPDDAAVAAAARINVTRTGVRLSIRFDGSPTADHYRLCSVRSR